MGRKQGKEWCKAKRVNRRSTTVREWCTTNMCGLHWFLQDTRQYRTLLTSGTEKLSEKIKVLKTFTQKSLSVLN